MAAEIIKVKLGDITQSGQTCENPTVTLIGAPGVVVNCANPDCNEWEIQLPDGFDEHCLQFSVTCDNCTTCPPTIIEYCFCETDEECSLCESCIDGICTQTSDSCCTTSEDCPCNQVCVNNECVCPANTQDCGATDGCCDECCDNDDCGVCEVCRQGNCVPKECPDGQVCNPESDICEGCVTDGDCGINECCVDNECDCCEGFVRDNCTGECVPAPPNPCQFNTDCDACYSCIDVDSCTGYGSCQPAQCPAGKVFSPFEGMCCHTPCDCDNPASCPSVREVCTAYQGSLCICLDCGQGCPDGDSDCREGCYCNGIENCVVDPCAGPCVNGTDCDNPLCGCLDGQCVSCDSLDCQNNPDECARTLGCECRGNICDETSCSQTTCQTALDCGVGCTCVDGQCVNCDNFSCLTDDCAQQEGCACVNGKCEGSEIDCADNLSIVKDDANCKIKGILTTERCCSCPVLTALLTITGASKDSSGNIDLSYDLELFQGKGTNSFNRLDNTDNPSISQNEQPEAQFTLSTGNSSASGATSASPVSGSINIPKPEASGSSLKLDISNLTNTGNDCTYSSEFDSVTITNGDFGVGKTIELELKSEDCKDPLFTWSKSGTSTFGDGSFRKVYVQGSGGIYTDILPANDTEACKTYSLQVDCGCAKSTSKYIAFCSPEFDLNIQDCGKTLKVEQQGNVCSKATNQTWILSVNGQVQKTGLYNEVAGTYAAGDFGVEKIDSAVVRLECDGSCSFFGVNENFDPDINITQECFVDARDLEITISVPAGFQLQYVMLNDGTNSNNVQINEATGEAFIKFSGLDPLKDLPSGGEVYLKDCGKLPFTFAKENCCDISNVTGSPICATKSVDWILTGTCDSYNLSGGSLTAPLTGLTRNALDALTNLSFDADYIVTDNCCGKDYFISVSSSDCCVLTGFSAVNSNSFQTITVTPPSEGGSGNYTIEVYVGSELIDTKSVEAGDPSYEVGGIDGNWNVVIRDTDYGQGGNFDPALCADQSTNGVPQSCDKTNPKTFDINTDCTVGAETLYTSIQASQARIDCPCLDYKLAVTASTTRVSGDGTINMILSVKTVQPTAISDLETYSSDGFVGGTENMTLNINGATKELDPSDEDYVIAIKPNNVSDVDIKFTFSNVNSVAGCTYNGTYTLPNMKIDANGAPTRNTDELILDGNGTNRKTEVVYFEEDQGVLTYFDRSINTANGWKTSETFTSGSSYVAALVCDCAIQGQDPSCEQCVPSNNAWIDGETFSACDPGQEYITFNITNDETNNVLELSSDNSNVTLSADSFSYDVDPQLVAVTGILNQLPDAECAVAPCAGIKIMVNQPASCDWMADTTIEGTVTDPEITAACDTDNNQIVYTIGQAGWEFDATGTNEFTVSGDSAEGLYAEVYDSGNTDCRFNAILPDIDCSCTDYSLAFSGTTCITTGDADTGPISFSSQAASSCPNTRMSWTLTGAGSNPEDQSSGGFVAWSETINLTPITSAGDGEYTFVLTDECGCTGTSTFEVTNSDCCTAAVDAGEVSFCPESTTLLTPGMGANTCQSLGQRALTTWSWNVCSGANSPNCTGASILATGTTRAGDYETIDDLVTGNNTIVSGGAYTYVVRDENDCNRCQYTFRIKDADDTDCAPDWHVCNLTDGQCSPVSEDECQRVAQAGGDCYTSLPSCEGGCIPLPTYKCTGSGCVLCTASDLLNSGVTCTLKPICEQDCICWDCVNNIEIRGPLCSSIPEKTAEDCTDCNEITYNYTLTAECALDFSGATGPGGEEVQCDTFETDISFTINCSNGCSTTVSKDCDNDVEIVCDCGASIKDANGKVTSCNCAGGDTELQCEALYGKCVDPNKNYQCQGVGSGCYCVCADNIE